jgi:hypothetical protein
MFFWNKKKVQVVVDETQLQEAGLELKVNPLALIHTYHECTDILKSLKEDRYHSNANAYYEIKAYTGFVECIESAITPIEILQSKEAKEAGLSWREKVLAEERRQVEEQHKQQEKQQLKNLIAKYGIPTEVIAGG